MQSSIRIHDTLAGEKRAFVPLVPGKVGMYVCGVTVYSDCHLGHARAGVVFDVVFRYLLHRGFEVTYVKNFTDVDDKIINKSLAEGRSPRQIAETYIRSFYRDMDGLLLLRPDHEPRVTEFIPQIIEMVGSLVANGHAYEVDGDVFFEIGSCSNYGELSGRKVDEQEDGARVDVDVRKRNPHDFALWKRAKEGEPPDSQWRSPWGMGRPGWHIECSAMSSTLLGSQFDIHGGGRDLIFPHHENEIAQSEGASEQRPYVRYWMHNGHLTLDAEKMSKSVGNLFTIEEVLSCYHPESVRLFFLTAQYRGPIDFNEGAIAESEAQLERLQRTLLSLDVALGDSLPRPAPDKDGGRRREHLHHPQEDPLSGLDLSLLSGPERGIHARVDGLMTKVNTAMDDDFNTAATLGHVFDFVRRVNRWLATEPDLARPELRRLLLAARDRLMQIGAIMGIFHEAPEAFFAGLKQRRLGFVGMSETEIERLISQRADARAQKDWARSDDLRDQLLARGVQIKDAPEGTVWSIRRGLRG